MRYLALVALLAFLAVPFMAGCAEKAPTKAPEKAPVKAPEKAGEKAPDVVPAAPAAPAAPAPVEKK
ncbi:MAG: hypothetical protein NTY65_07990 [Planctomycetota bacterium]|jgi:hypothetical protein|nr:hypothetical protein [Planctomycetota bacterium]